MRKQPKVLCTELPGPMQCSAAAIAQGVHVAVCACAASYWQSCLPWGPLSGLLVWLRVTQHGAALCVGPVSVGHVGHSLCEERDTKGAGVSQRQVGVYGLHLPNCWCVRVVGHRQAGAWIE
jgi:hypothetical protein